MSGETTSGDSFSSRTFVTSDVTAPSGEAQNANTSSVLRAIANINGMTAAIADNQISDVRVLIVAARQSRHDNLLSKLESAGFVDLIAAPQPEEALTVIRESRPDIVFLQFDANNVRATDLVSALRADPRISRTPVVAVTHWDDHERRHMAWTAGVEEFITLPTDPIELHARVHSVLRATGHASQEPDGVPSRDSAEHVRRQAEQLKATCDELIDCLSNAGTL